ncbi:hypothetical protein PoB_002054300 [Plakobranchus ocellatus]|uniref:Glycine N-acyltransferase-like protein n=1 Tax=Plakobranchus ocellatus TaxID=259542 RepID=A0AAV3ZGW2_9GAST|nr:hypothetical protein PoB_002054300 [Plakobranchus ocellatus]
MLQGRWRGSTLVTLGWPDILAVGEGPDILAVGAGPVPEDSPCYKFHASPRCTFVFSPDPEHLETLLLYPDCLDWSQSIIFQGVNKKNRPVLDKIIEAKGSNCHIDTYSILEAGREELPPRYADDSLVIAESGKQLQKLLDTVVLESERMGLSLSVKKTACMVISKKSSNPKCNLVSKVPEGLELRALDGDLDIDYINSTREETRDGEASFIKELIRRFLSVGLFDGINKCVGLELGEEFGTLGMLHVREDFRGRDLGKVITSQLAQKCFRDDLPVCGRGSRRQ